MTSWNEELLEKYLRRWKNWFPLARKLVFTIAKIRFVFKKWFRHISVTVSAGRKELSSKIDGFYYTKNSFPIAGMRDLLKNTFALDGKKAYGLY